MKTCCSIVTIITFFILKYYLIICYRDNKLLTTGTDVGEIFLWSFLDYSFIQQIPGITKFHQLLVILD